MRILRLSVAGFGPYKTAQHVDFEAFRDDGLFLITGKTGAGKSSILDAICYALYGSVPRYESTQQRLRSDHCGADDPSFVELEFLVGDEGGTRYRVRRSPEYERPKARGTGTTVQKTTAQLDRLVDGEWQGIAARPVDVGNELDRILRLSKDQFLQVILLAQNRFQQFLLARNDDRQAVLRTLFGTRRFEQIEAALIERQKALRAQLESGRQGVAHQAALVAGLLAVGEDDAAPEEPGVTWFEAALAALDTQLQSAEAHAGEADRAFAEADAAHRALVDTRKAQSRRDAAAARLAEHEAEQDAIDAERRTLADARRAAVVWPQLTALRAAEAARVAARSLEADARAAYAGVGSGESTAESLAIAIDETTRRLGTLESVAAEERRLPELDADAEHLNSTAEARAAAVADATERIEALPPRIDSVTAALTAARVQAAGEADARGRVERSTVARDAALLARELESEHDQALADETEASGAHAAAAARVHELMRQRLAGYAGELAAALVSGDPCAVCGSVEHPAPAAGDAAPVTEGDIELAKGDADRAAAAYAAATALLGDVATRLAGARSAAGGKTLDQLDDELAAAHAALRDVEAAHADAERLEAERERLRGELDAATTGLAGLRAESEAASRRRAEHSSILTSIADRVAQHLGGFESVAAHVESLQEQLAAANRLVQAITAVEADEKAVRSATSVLHAQLAEHDFADEQAVETARRTLAEITAIDARIREHEQAVSSARATLAEPELAGLPAEPVDLDAAAERLTSARTARDAALAARSSVAQRRTQVAQIVTSVRAQQAASAALDEEYQKLRELASVVQGNEPNTKRMRLETYVLAAQLEEIVAAANLRLRAMTSGRYALEHDDSLQYRGSRSGLGLAILDQHTGRSRPTHSLSGGETFLASLALALGLAEVVTQQAGGITLDTLFIDEGFGSLDADTLEIAMATLDSLRAGGRTIGLISHVEAMKEQIPAKLRISVTPQGDSEIAPDYELAAV
ncbi:AAA family ATPase [Cryobacterium tepidiphilum]|uniref:Nuclease SbcCD subunit C n=1 Tax=Cryobacterium tepidiphilum TaxID=2486026 RepID=A0A3M8L9T6_9MICO|nr:SMC family ATPase [Cryobacterium tepidiphilum]RNE62267.1 SMC family ATPase [Cryobacterium tepidiphilum]